MLDNLYIFGGLMLMATVWTACLELLVLALMVQTCGWKQTVKSLSRRKT